MVDGLETGVGSALGDVFDGIVGNGASLGGLRSALQGGGSHAYLFHGPSGVGKRTVARRFGAALVSGGEESAYLRAIHGSHPDLTEVLPEGNFTTIDQIRDVVRLASSRPMEGVRRVIILYADSFNPPSANALLKTLEEPEGDTVFVLLTASRGGVMPTVSSRARAVRFDPVPQKELVSHLVSLGVEEPEVAAALGRGSVGLALRYAADPEYRQLRETVFRAGMSFEADFEERHGMVGAIISRAEAVGAAREEAVLADVEEGENPDRRRKDAAKRAGRGARDFAVRESVEILAMLYRDLAVTQAGAESLVCSVDRVQEIKDTAARFPDADWVGAAYLLEEARGELAYNVSAEATLEVALSRIRRRILSRGAHSPGS